MLNDQNTRGKIGNLRAFISFQLAADIRGVRKQLLSQFSGSLFFGIAGGQVFLIMLSTAPISIYISIIQSIADAYDLDFFNLYTTIGCVSRREIG